MYINDYSNNWNYLWSADKIEVTEYTSGYDLTSGAGVISTIFPWSDWSYGQAYLSAARTALFNSPSYPMTNLATMNGGTGHSNYMPVIKLKSKTGGSDKYLLIPIRFNYRDSNEVFYYDNDDPARFDFITGYFSARTGSTRYNISGYTADSVAEAEAIRRGYYNAISYLRKGTDDGNWYAEIEELSYKSIIDKTNGVIMFSFWATKIYTCPEYGGETTTEDHTELYIALGALADEYEIETNSGGGYPMPTSDIPLKDTLNPYGTNFKTSIDIYDETNEDVNNMFLANYVGTLAYTFVRFSEPSGTIRCATSMQFTHFVTRSFTDNDTPRIYRVTGRRVININVIEYDFTIDYLKDYWQHFGITNSNYPIVARSTDIQDFNKYIDDPILPYNGKYVTETYGTYSVQAYVAIVFNFPYSDTTGREDSIMCFAMPFAEYARFVSWWNSDTTVQQYQSRLATYIDGVYAIPYSTIGSDIYLSSVSSFTLPLGDTTVTYTVSDTAYLINTGNRLNTNISNYVYGQIDCSGIDMADCRYFNSNAIAHIPFYGDIPVNKETLIVIDTSSVLTYKYIINLNDGSIALSCSPYVDVLPAVPLPKLALPMDTSAQAIRQFDRDKYVAYATGIAAAAINPTSILSSAGGLAQLENRAQTLKETAGRKSHSSTGLISLYQQPTLKFELPDLAIDIDDYYALVGYPALRLWTGATAGCKYWLTLTSGLCGTEEYIQGVKNAINNRGIVYNYS